MKEKLREHVWLIIYAAIAVIVPLSLGVVLSIHYENFVYLESILVIAGCFTLVFGLFRSFHRDTKNVRKTHTVFEDKSTEDYKGYRLNQLTLYALGLLLLVGSLITFLISKNFK
ncbi:MAG: hypothetical protein SPL02_01335 [Bacilli bacterium]|nr:hypothetical protein [Bacilli bacterium]MDY6430315.1 hypothetical protein [Bacilli bacterium]